jgi:hypothetical protein
MALSKHCLRHIALHEGTGVITIDAAQINAEARCSKRSIQEMRPVGQKKGKERVPLLHGDRPTIRCDLEQPSVIARKIAPEDDDARPIPRPAKLIVASIACGDAGQVTDRQCGPSRDVNLLQLSAREKCDVTAVGRPERRQ